jgi:hypothetical protein
MFASSPLKRGQSLFRGQKSVQVYIPTLIDVIATDQTSQHLAETSEVVFQQTDSHYLRPTRSLENLLPGTSALRNLNAG